jgi:pimeloyl-ACP methyl ester carboxylesterase
MENLSDAGGICISGTAYDQVENKLGLSYEYLGEQTVKNIAKPVRVYRVLIDSGTFASTNIIDQHIQFCTTVDGVRIAYALVGHGPFLVFPPAWVSHLQLQLEHPFTREYLEKGTRNQTFLLYDRHGCGLSERNRTEFTLESEVRSLEAVIDHLKLKRFALFGFSCGGPIATAYAIKYPRRVSHLILFDSYARGEALTTEEFKKSFISLVRSAWGVGSKALADMFLPGGDVSALKWITRLQREAATAETAAKLLDLSYNLNVTDLLPRLRVPTLVIHRKGCKAIPFNLGREMASMIPNSRFVPLEGSIHLPFFGDADAVLRITGEFLGIPAHGKDSIR